MTRLSASTTPRLATLRTIRSAPYTFAAEYARGTPTLKPRNHLERLVRHRQREIDVGCGVGEGKKHVVLRMHVDATAQGLLHEARAAGIVGVILKQDGGHLRRATLPDTKIVAPRLLGDAVAQPLAHFAHLLRA